MPTLSMFYGIIITMYPDEHNPPHFHAKYGEYRASFDFDGNLIKGDMPKPQTRLIQAWVVLHHDELVADWDLITNKQAHFPIKPL